MKQQRRSRPQLVRMRILMTCSTLDKDSMSSHNAAEPTSKFLKASNPPRLLNSSLRIAFDPFAHGISPTRTCWADREPLDVKMERDGRCRCSRAPTPCGHAARVKRGTISVKRLVHWSYPKGKWSASRRPRKYPAEKAAAVGPALRADGDRIDGSEIQHFGMAGQLEK